MATLYYQTFGSAVEVAKGSVLDEGQLGIGGTSVPSAAFNARARILRVVPDIPCVFTTGADPTANNITGGGYLPAHTVEYRDVGGGDKVAVVQAA